MKTISLPDDFARATERWLDGLDDDGTTDAISGVIGLEPDHAFTDAAAAALASADVDR